MDECIYICEDSSDVNFKAMENEYPQLSHYSKMARDILDIPITTIASESTFLVLVVGQLIHAVDHYQQNLTKCCNLGLIRGENSVTVTGY